MFWGVLSPCYCNFCGRTIGLQIPYRWCHFNPRSRGGSDLPIAIILAQVYNISIHAPAEGATKTVKQTFPISNISIHAPAEGATQLSCQKAFPRIFQSTLPRRERQADPPGRGASESFQSTLPRRERQTQAAAEEVKQEFQSTLPRRKRLVV